MIIMTICTTNIITATSTCFLMTPFLSFISKIATEQTVNQPAGTPGMNLKDIAKAIELSVEAMLESDTDIKVVSGETH